MATFFILPLVGDFMITVDSCFDKRNPKFQDLFSYQTLLQDDYNILFSNFMSSSPTCPFCSSKLHKHDSFNRTFYCALGKINIVCRRVYCPHCGKTHRVLPSYIIPGHQISSVDADTLLFLVGDRQSCTLFSLESLLSFSSIYLFFKKIKNYFHDALNAKSFYSLFPSQNNGLYRELVTDFFHFRIFQPDIGCITLSN